MKTRLLALFALVWMAGCAHEETVENADRAASTVPEKKLTVLFHANRHSELEPCGCSLNPTGGVEREFNFKTKVEGEIGGPLMSFAAGSTFVPEQDTFSPKQTKLFQKKANYVVQALNQLGVKAIAPSSNDFKLGVAELKKLEAASQFTWIASNVVDAKTGKPVFAKFHQFKEGNDEYLVLGFTAPPAKKFETSEIKVIPAKDVLNEILSDARFAGKFIIVLNDLPGKEWVDMGALASRVRLVLGGDDSYLTYGSWVPLSSSTLYVNPETRTKSYARLDLSWVEPVIGFHHPSFVAYQEDRRRAVEGRVEELKVRMTTKLSQKDKREAQAKLAEAEKVLAGLSSASPTRLPGQASAEASIFALESSFSGKNSLSQLVSNWQREVRSLATK